MFDVGPAWVQVLNSVSMYVPAIRAFLFLQQENVMHSPEVRTNTYTTTQPNTPDTRCRASLIEIRKWS
jgi:hypothetical protein